MALTLSVVSATFVPLHFLYERVLFAMGLIAVAHLPLLLMNYRRVLAPLQALRKDRKIADFIKNAISSYEDYILVIAIASAIAGSVFGLKGLTLFGVLLAALQFAFSTGKKDLKGLLTLSFSMLPIAFFNTAEISAKLTFVVLTFFAFKRLGHKKPLLYFIFFLASLGEFYTEFLNGNVPLYWITIAILLHLYFNKRTKKVGWILSLVALALSIAANFLFNLENIGTKLMQLSPLLLLTLALTMDKVHSSKIKLSYILLPLTLLGVGADLYLLDFSGDNWSEQTRIKSNVAQMAPEITPAPAGRQLEFVETPITNETDLSTKIGTSFFVLGKYLQLAFVPHPLSYYYGYKKIPLVEWTHWFSLLSLLVHLALIVIAIIFLKREPLLSYGILIYLACISIFSNLAAPVAGLMADRYLFSASIGFCIVLAWALLKIFKVDVNNSNLKFAQLPKGLLITAGIILLSYSVKTITRNAEWEDKLTLYLSDIRHLDESAQAHNLLALELVNEGVQSNDPIQRDQYLKEAQQHFQDATDVYDEFFNAWFDLGRTSMMLNDYRTAAMAFQKVIEIDPEFSDAYLQIALMLDEQGKMEKAIEYYRKALEHNPQNVGIYTNLSMIYFKQGDFQKAIAINKDALKTIPNAYDPLVNIGKTFYNMEQMDSALVYFEKAYRVNPNDQNLVNMIQGLRQGKSN